MDSEKRSGKYPDPGSSQSGRSARWKRDRNGIRRSLSAWIEGLIVDEGWRRRRGILPNPQPVSVGLSWRINARKPELPRQRPVRPLAARMLAR